MFGFFRRKRTDPRSPVATTFDEANSDEERELKRVDEHVSEVLETM